MSFDHSLNACIKVKHGVTPDQIAAAFQPIFAYLGCDGVEVVTGQQDMPSDLDKFSWDVETCTIDVYTCGEVADSYSELVQEVATAIGPLSAEPGELELCDHRTGDLHNAISYFEYGESLDAINAWRKAGDVTSALELLAEHFDPEVMAKVRGIVSPAIAPT